MHHGFGRGGEQAIGHRTPALAHQALERVAMNAVKVEELLHQSRRMIDSRAQLGEIRRGRERRVLNHAAQLSEQV